MKSLFKTCLALLLSLALFASCGQKNGARALAVVNDDQEAFALVLRYSVPLSAASVNAGTFTVSGREVKAALVTHDNPFTDTENNAAGHWVANKHDGNFVVVILQDGKSDVPAGEIKVQQVADIKAYDGKTLKAWKSPIKIGGAVPFSASVKAAAAQPKGPLTRDQASAEKSE